MAQSAAPPDGARLDAVLVRRENLKTSTIDSQRETPTTLRLREVGSLKRRFFLSHRKIQLQMVRAVATRLRQDSLVDKCAFMVN